MIYILGLTFSCLITGFVYLEILDDLYERKYNERKWLYCLFVLLNTILNVSEAQLGYPLLNIVYSLFVLCLVSLLLYYTERRDVIVNSVMIVIYVSIVDLIVTTIFSTLTQSSAYIVLQDPKFFCVSGIANGLAILCTCHTFSYMLRKRKISNMSASLQAYMIFLLVFEFSLLLYLLPREPDIDNNVIILTFCICFVAVDIGVLYLFEKVSQNFELEKKTQLLMQQRELLVNYHESLQERFIDSQKLLHDMKKHLQVISNMSEKEKTMQKEYTDRLLEEIEDIQRQFQCSDKIVCAILWDKIQICKHDNIELDINMQDIVFDFMEKTDVTALFANLLDNAIEACKKDKQNTSRILLRIHKFKDYVIIKMTNTMSQTPKKTDNRLVSTKEGHTGLGMSILSDLANKYCGNINYSYTDIEFETNIILSTNCKI
nr:GHKL domain-containing protein [uncultured Blautia sp.]